MSTNINILRGKMVEKSINAETLSRKIGMHPCTFYRKMQMNGDTFTVGQMHKIVEVLGLTAEEAKSIFLW